jgi:hypothetical protein
MLLFTGLVARFVFNAHITNVLLRTNSSFGHAALIGFAVAVLFPIAIVLSLVSVLGGVLGMLMLFGYLLAIGVALALSGMFLGGFVSKYVTGAASYSPLWISLGTALFYALTFLPVVGHILVLVIILMVLGGFSARVYEHYR